VVGTGEESPAASEERRPRGNVPAASFVMGGGVAMGRHEAPRGAELQRPATGAARDTRRNTAYPLKWAARALL